MSQKLAKDVAKGSITEARAVAPEGKYQSRLKDSECKGGRTRYVVDYTWGGEICYRVPYGNGRNFTEHKCTVAEWKEYMLKAKFIRPLRGTSE